MLIQKPDSPILLVSLQIPDSPRGQGLATAQLQAAVEGALGNTAGIVRLDGNLGDSWEHLLERIQATGATIIGFSIYVWNHDLTLRLAREIKGRDPETILFAGGPQVTAIPDRYLETGDFDFVIAGEGEGPLIQVVGGIRRGEIPHGIEGLRVKGEKVDHPPVVAFEQDLDRLSSPYLTGVIDPTRATGILWEQARGCIYKCKFCYEGKGVAGVRYRNLETLRQEAILFRESGVSQIHVLDPTFNQNPERAMWVLEMLHREAPEIHYLFEVRSEFLNGPMADAFARLHCSLQLGLESAVPEVVRMAGRSFNPESFREKVQLLNDRQIVFGLDLIYGLPGDTVQGFYQSLDFAVEMQPNHLDLFPLSVLPGTQFYEEREKHRIGCDPHPPYRITRSPGFSPEDLASLDRLCERIDFFYNRGGAVGWLFMVLETTGISPSDFFRRLDNDWKKYEPTLLELGDPVRLQCEFVQDLFSSAGLLPLYGPMEDVIRLHGAMRESLQAGSDSDPTKEGDRIARGTRILRLHHHPEHLEELGELDLSDFLNEFGPEESCVIVYNCSGEVRSITVEEEYYQSLQTNSGRMDLSSLLPEDRDEWVEFARAEGIVV